MSSDLSYIYNNQYNTYDEFIANVSKELQINANDYFFYYQNQNKKYGIFNNISFQKFKQSIKDQDKVKILYKNKKTLIKNHFNYTFSESLSDDLNLKRDNLTQEIDDAIEEYLNKYNSCMNEISERNKDITRKSIQNLKEISYNEETNDKFIQQIMYENVMKNCRPIPSPEDNNSKYFVPQEEEICHYCKNNNINQLYGCEKCEFKICEFCFQSLQTYQHFHKLSIYKTN